MAPRPPALTLLGYALAGVVLVLVLQYLWRNWDNDEPVPARDPAAAPAAATAAPIDEERGYRESPRHAFPTIARPLWAEDQDQPEEDEPEDELVDEAVEAAPTGERSYVRLSMRKSFCRHLVELTAREWAVEDPAYNAVLERIRGGPSVYPDTLRGIYEDCLDSFVRRNITEKEVRCSMRAGSLAEVENCEP